MIFSHKHRFIFIKGRKVAGTSIEIALSPYCGPQDIITPISPVDELKRLAHGGKPQNYGAPERTERKYLTLVRAGKMKAAIKTRVHTYSFFNHMPLAAVEELLNPQSEDYTLVYAVRDPYRKIASLANMQISFQNYSGEAMENPLEEIRKSISRLFETGDYMRVHNQALYQSQRPYKAEVVLRQEHLSDDFGNLLRHLGIDEGRQEMPHVKKGSSGKGYSIEDMFTREQLDIVNTEFADEFHTHGYTMI